MKTGFLRGGGEQQGNEPSVKILPSLLKINYKLTLEFTANSLQHVESACNTFIHVPLLALLSFKIYIPHITHV